MIGKRELYEMVATTLSVEEGAVEDGASLLDDLGADSLLLVELGELIAERCSIDIDVDDIMEVANAGELYEIVRARIGDR